MRWLGGIVNAECQTCTALRKEIAALRQAYIDGYINGMVQDREGDFIESDLDKWKAAAERQIEVILHGLPQY